MKDNELKKLLDSSVNPPKEKIWQRIETQLFPDAKTEQVLATNVNTTKGTRKNFSWLYSLCVLFIVVIIALACILPTILNAHPPLPLDYSGAFFIDINPSIQVLVDKDGNATEIVPLNKDALVLLEGTDKRTFIGKSSEEVAVTVWDLALKTGYISLDTKNNAIWVTGALSNEDLNGDLSQRISNRLMENIKKKGVFCAVLQEEIDNTLQSEADRHGISISKYQHIRYAIDCGVKIEESEYQTITMADINTRVKEHGKKVEEFGGDKYQVYELIEDYIEEQVEFFIDGLTQAIGDIEKMLELHETLDCVEEQLDYLKEVLEELEDEDDEEDIEALFNQLDRALFNIADHHPEIASNIELLRGRVSYVKERFDVLHQEVTQAKEDLKNEYEIRVNGVKEKVENHNRPDNFDDDYEDWLEDYHKNQHGNRYPRR